MIRVPQSLKLLLGAFTLFGYISVLIYTPLHMIEMADMNMPMEHCPFAMSQHVICTMTLSEHMREWQLMLQNPLPIFTLLILAATIFSYRSFAVLSLSLLKLLQYHKRRRALLFFSFLEDLLARGILNPKVY